jgi:hypothetical protein
MCHQWCEEKRRVESIESGEIKEYKNLGEQVSGEQGHNIREKRIPVVSSLPALISSKRAGVVASPASQPPELHHSRARGSEQRMIGVAEMIGSCLVPTSIDSIGDEIFGWDHN